LKKFRGTFPLDVKGSHNTTKELVIKLLSSLAAVEAAQQQHSELQEPPARGKQAASDALPQVHVQ
jgi:hypothetical protein